MNAPSRNHIFATVLLEAGPEPASAYIISRRAWRVKRWRHLDLGANRCVIECCLRRLWCWDCGVRYEAVPWARADAFYTRDFEDVVAWLAQQMAKTPIAGLLRIRSGLPVEHHGVPRCTGETPVIPA